MLMDIELLSFREALDSFNILVAIALFVFYLIIETLDSSLTFSLVQHKSMQSGIVTFILYTTVAIEIIAIVSNYLYIIPVAIGAGLGSYTVVEYEKKKRPLKKKRK